MKILNTVASMTLIFSVIGSSAQQAVPAAGAASQAAQPWRYKTKQLSRDEVDALLATPQKLLVLDVRRPDEQIRYGSFPVFLSIQAKDLEKQLDYLPRERAILTVSNHAQRAGAAGDLLAAKGFVVAGAAGSEDYEQAGGKAVAHITAPAPRVAAAASAPRP